MHMIIAENYGDLSARAARRVAGYINRHPNTLVCFAAGDTPMGMLRELIRLQEAGETDLAGVYYAELDEWVGLGPDDKGSCHRVMTDAYYGPAGIPPERVHLFDGLDPDTDRQCRLMEAWLESHGGISLSVLGVGMNGHIGFNEPCPPDHEGCAVIPLDETTKSVSIKYFGAPRPVETGITITWRTLKKAETMIVIAAGEGKAGIVRRSFCEPPTPAVPASLLQDHGDLCIVLDEAAAAKI